MEVVSTLKAQPQRISSAFVLLWIATVGSWVSFTTTSWGVASSEMIDEQFHFGLWRRCNLISTGCNQLDGYANVWYGAVQAFAIFGHMGVNTACLLIVLYIFWSKCKNEQVSKAAGIICLTTAFSWAVAVVLFGIMFTEEDDDFLTESLDRTLGFSFRLAISALVLEAIAGGLIVYEIKNSTQTTTTTTAVTSATTATTTVITVSAQPEDPTEPESPAK